MSDARPTDSPLIDELFKPDGLSYGAFIHSTRQGHGEIVMLSATTRLTVIERQPYVLHAGGTDYRLTADTEIMTWPEMNFAAFRCSQQTFGLFGSHAQAAKALYARIGKMEFAAPLATQLMLQLGYEPEYVTKYVDNAARASAAETAFRAALAS